MRQRGGRARLGPRRDSCLFESSMRTRPFAMFIRHWGTRNLLDLKGIALLLLVKLAFVWYQCGGEVGLSISWRC